LSAVTDQGRWECPLLALLLPLRVRSYLLGLVHACVTQYASSSSSSSNSICEGLRRGSHRFLRRHSDRERSAGGSRVHSDRVVPELPLEPLSQPQGCMPGSFCATSHWKRVLVALLGSCARSRPKRIADHCEQGSAIALHLLHINCSFLEVEVHSCIL
jgi:hypothetical protein